MTPFHLPILRKELLVLLRARRTFLTAFFFYALLTTFLTIVWAIMLSLPYLIYDRDAVCRFVFYSILVFGFFGFCLHGGTLAARSLATERERRTEDFLKSAPFAPWRFVFQKAVTPLAMEWFLFIGLLPALSLVFLMGGIDPSEFAYQMMNLAVWINTSILTGLWASSRAKSTTRGVGKTMLWIILLSFALPFSPTILAAAHRQCLEMLSVKEFPAYLREIPIFVTAWMFFALTWVTLPLEALSPVWMVLSWNIEFLPGHIPLTESFFLISAYAPPLLLFCPALISWMFHLFLQAILFRRAIAGWRSRREDTSVTPSRVGFRTNLRDITRRWKSWRPRRGHFSTGCRAIYQLEDRMVFAKGLRTKAAGLIVVVVFPLILEIFTINIAEAHLIWVITGACMVGFILILSPLSFRRERNRNTGQLLLATPQRERTLFFGKWAYYLSAALVLLMILLPALSYVISGIAHRTIFRRDNVGVDFFRSHFNQGLQTAWITSMAIGCFIPLFSMSSLLMGLRKRTNPGLQQFLAALILLMGAPFGVSWLIMNVDLGNPMLEHLSLLIYDLAAWLILITTMGFLIRRARTFSSAREKFRWWVGIALLGLVFSLLFDAAGKWWGPDRTVWGTVHPEIWKVSDVRDLGRVFILPLCLAYFLWSWIATRPRSWWIENLLGVGGGGCG